MEHPRLQWVTRFFTSNVRAETFVGTGHGFRVVLAPTLP
jgi:hypothetical protein